MQADGSSVSTVVSLSTAVAADVILLGFCWLTSSFVLLLGCGSKRMIFKFHYIRFARQTKRLPTKGFVQLGLDVETIIGSAYPGFTFGGRNSVGLLVLILYF